MILNAHCSADYHCCELRYLQCLEERSQTSAADFKTFRVGHLLLLLHSTGRWSPWTTPAWFWCPFFNSFSLISPLPAWLGCDFNNGSHSVLAGKVMSALGSDQFSWLWTGAFFVAGGWKVKKTKLVLCLALSLNQHWSNQIKSNFIYIELFVQ